MKIKTGELEGAALDWAVAKCEGNHVTFADGTGHAPVGTPSGQWEMYSSNWSQGGPIIERERITIDYYPDGGHPKGGEWGALTNEGTVESFGPTPLTAAMRCYVAAKLGDEVEIPAHV